MNGEGLDWVELIHLGALSEPEEWLEKARKLKKASEVYLPHLEAYWDTTGKKRKDLEPFYHAYLMLMAFSIENLAKGIILQKADPTEFMKQYRKRRLFSKGGLLVLP